MVSKTCLRTTEARDKSRFFGVFVIAVSSLLGYSSPSNERPDLSRLRACGRCTPANALKTRVYSPPSDVCSMLQGRFLRAVRQGPDRHACASMRSLFRCNCYENWSAGLLISLIGT